MKILHIIGFYDDRYFFRERYYTRSLAEMGHEVYLLTSTNGLSQDPTSPQKPSGREMTKGVTIIRVDPKWRFRDSIDFPFEEHIRNIKPDVVHTYEARQYVTKKVIKYCHKMGIPVVYEHEQRTDGEFLLGKIRSKLTINWWIRSVSMLPQIVRTVTPGGRVHFLKHAKGPREVEISSLGFDETTHYFSPDDRKATREKYGFSEDEIVVGFSGKMDPSKKPEMIIDIINQLDPEKKVRLFAVFGGPEDYVRSLEERAESSKRKIVLVNHLLKGSEHNGFMNACDYFLWTKPTISYFEALATGARIIIPYGSGTSHLQSDSITFFGKLAGLSYEMSRIMDTNAISKELFEILSSLQPYERRIEADVAVYEVKNIAKDLLDQYRRAIQINRKSKQEI